MDIFLGRQPILNAEGNIYAYELLYRSSEENRFVEVCPERATATVLVHAFLSMGIDEVSGDYLSFINFNEEMLKQDFMTNLNPRKVVIELLEDVVITPMLIYRLKELRKLGFRIALDDFVMQENFAYPEIFQIVSIIKVDFLNTSLAERMRIESLVERYPHLILLAEKVETEEVFEEAKARGYRLFQGYFFAKPEMLQRKDIPPNFMLYFHILSEIDKESPNVDDITELVMRDVSLSYKLLKYINSLAFNLSHEISSIRQAIMLIGIEETKKWLQVLYLYEANIDERGGRLKALLDASLARAKFCELLAKHKKKQYTEEYFLVGMFSLIDRIMQRPWDYLLEHLPLSPLIKKTIQGEETELSPYLRFAIALESFELEKIEELIVDFDLTFSEVSRLSVEVQQWIRDFDRLATTD